MLNPGRVDGFDQDEADARARKEPLPFAASGQQFPGIGGGSSVDGVSDPHEILGSAQVSFESRPEADGRPEFGTCANTFVSRQRPLPHRTHAPIYS